jgi:hypothetical protein
MTPTCPLCHQALRAAASVAAGYGPVCAERAGVAYGEMRERAQGRAPRVRRAAMVRRAWEQLDLWAAECGGGNSTTPAGEIAEVACPQP